MKNSKGELIFSGQALGNPLPALQRPAGRRCPGGGYDTVRIWGFQNANYDWKTFDLDRDMPIINSKVGFVDAVDPDLSKFKARGGKLLLYAGWGDTGITPENTVLYYESVLKRRWARTRTTGRGSSWCPAWATAAAATAPTRSTPSARWRPGARRGAAGGDHGLQPEIGLSRPLCAYPQYAKYKGTGELKDAANWKCTAP